MRVDARSLIARVSQRLTLVRRINLACTLLPVIAAALLFLLLTDSLPAWANLIALGGLLLAAIALVSLARPYRRAATHTDAALLIDRSLASKERFLTLATADQRADKAVLEELETQGNQLAASFSDSEHLAFALERPAKYSVAAACPILIAIAVLALTRESVAPSARTGAASAAQELRELIDRAPTLPPSLASDLAELADTLDEKGLLDPETIRQIDETFLEAAALEQGELKPELSQEEQGAQNNQSAEPTPTKAPNKSGEDTGEEQQPPPAEKPETVEKREDQQPPADQNAEPTPPPQSPQQLKEEAKPQPGSKGQQGNQAGNSGSEQGGKKEQAREGEGREEKQDDKTDETGVGEGKGKGKNGETKEQQGETQTGENSDGAKEGDAKNQSGDSQQENSKSNDATQGEQGKSDSIQKTGKKSDDAREVEGKDKQESSDSKSPSRQESVSEAREKLEELKKQAKQEQQSEKGAPEDPDAPGDKTEGNAQQGENGKPDESSKEQGSKENGKKQSGDQQKPGDGKEKGGDQPSDANDAKPNPDQAGKKAGGKNTGQEKKREDSRPNAGEDDGSDQSASGDGSKAPNANDNAQRFGPFEGGTDGSILKGNEEQTRVEVPKEESLVIRGLGREDPRLYRNKEGTAAQRELGSAEFKKPEAETSRERQPIPPEYSDLLR